jgi:hypothetical protein
MTVDTPSESVHTIKTICILTVTLCTAKQNFFQVYFNVKILNPAVHRLVEKIILRNNKCNQKWEHRL